MGVIGIQELIEDLLSIDKDVLSTLDNLDPANKFERNITPIDTIAGGNTFIWVGPPLQHQALKYPRYLRPVGACTSVSQQDARAWLTVTEFGQQHMYKIPGKIQFALNITKIQTGKGDFYQTFYEWLQKHWGELGYKSITWNEDPSVYDDTPPFMDNPSTTPSTINAPYFVGTKQIKNPSSELMLFPFGLLIAQYDQGYNLVKKYYAENCRILSKSSSMDPNSPYVVEQGQIVPFRYVPTIISIKMKNKSVYVVPDDSVSQEHSNGATGGNGAFTPNVVVPSTSLLSAAPDLALAVNSPLSTFTT